MCECWGIKPFYVVHTAIRPCNFPTEHLLCKTNNESAPASQPPKIIWETPPPHAQSKPILFPRRSHSSPSAVGSNRIPYLSSSSRSPDSERLNFSPSSSSVRPTSARFTSIQQCSVLPESTISSSPPLSPYATRYVRVGGVVVSWIRSPATRTFYTSNPQ